MFGYVRIGKENLSEENYLLFCAYYCGLCKAMGKYSHISRLGLSYDMTFLAVLLFSVSENEPEFVFSRCAFHSFKKEKAVKGSIMEYTAAVSILLGYKKAEDDWADDKSMKALFVKAALFFAVRGISKQYKEAEEKIDKYLKRLSELERDGCTEIDEVADCFAKICGELFAPNFIKDEKTKKILAWMGYNVGRWIYFTDAADDIEKDIKNNSYNPFKERYSKDKEKCLKDAEMLLTYNLANISAAYDLLDFKRNDGIIKNIIYSGMGGIQNKILNVREEKDESLRGSRCKSER